MALSPIAVKWIAIVVVVVVGVFLVVSIIWDALKIALGLLIGGGLIYLGIRFLFGKGLPPGMRKIADKAMQAARAEDSAKTEENNAEEK